MNNFPAIKTEQEMASEVSVGIVEGVWLITAPDAYIVMVDGIFSLKNQAVWELNEADALLNQSS